MPFPNEPTFKPEGLILPDCHCFKTKTAVMNKEIDKASVFGTVDAVIAADALNICPAAKDYYIAAFVWSLMTTLLKPNPGDSPIVSSMDNYRSQFEEIYDRLRPLVMQRIDYSDGVVDTFVRKGK